jgi:hypothetical protein
MMVNIETQERKGDVGDIDNRLALEFISHHGVRRNPHPSIKIKSLGCHVGEELVGVAQFCAPRTPARQKTYSTELLTLCCRKELPIRGMAGKLINYYKEHYHPADIFTYQNSMGGDSCAYKECGLSFQGGSRDKLWEWFNPDLTFYTYKITATDSHKHYYGVRHIKKALASLDDCLLDDYDGSGGRGDQNKFNNWKAKHSRTLQKEVLSTFTSKAPAYHEERVLVGGKWQTDSNSLNSRPGGMASFITKARVHKAFCQNCNTVTNHKGDSCCQCTALKNISLRICSRNVETNHGITKHKGDACCSCSIKKGNSKQYCQKHGEVIFTGAKCRTCLSQEQISFQHCDSGLHGLTKHQKGRCLKCSSAGNLTLMDCDKHGTSYHRGKTCLKCKQADSYSKEYCPLHQRMTKHHGGACCSCLAQKSIIRRLCPKHGDTKFHGSACRACISEKATHTRWHGDNSHPSCHYCYMKVIN